MRHPTPMLSWLERQFDNAERTVQTWSEAKRIASGIVPDHYTELQEIARRIWNHLHPSVEAVYVQMTQRDGSEWRISDINGSLRGYVTISTRSVTGS